MKRQLFFLSLGIITLLGFLLRLYHYDMTPGWNESLDEIHYAWTGQTWLNTGIPTSWSYLSSYPTTKTIRLWNTDFRIVSPMLEKPPLYSLLSGITVLLFGQDELTEARISTIRLLPLVLSILSIYLTGLVGRKVFSPTVGLVGALLYATVPPFVLANRLSVTENLPTPLMLSVQLIFLTTSLPSMRPHFLLVSIFSALAILTKQIGVVIAFSSILIFALQKKWKPAVICTLIAGSAFFVYLLIGLYFDWDLFRTIQTEQRRIGLQGGLPQLIQTLVSRPLITTEKLFPDGVLLLGYLLFFVSPWLLFPPLRIRGGEGELRKSNHNPSLPPLILRGKTSFDFIVFLTFPFVYITYLVLFITGAEPIGSGQGYWGWYAYPLFPYLTILVAYILVKLWHSYSIFEFFITTLILGSSLIRYFFLTLPRQYHYRWQPALMLLLVITLATKFLPETYRKQILILLFGIFIGVNMYASMNLSLLYSTNPQP